MKKLRTFICHLIILSLSLCATHAMSASTRGIHVVSKQGKEVPLYKDYHALVVGVSEYTDKKWPDLPNAVKDARDVAASLKDLGFTVTEAYNPTSQQLKKALNDLTYGKGREKNRAIVLYFAGHGETEKLADGTKLGYIIPSDCPVLQDDPREFVNHAISMKDIEAYSLRIRSKHLLALFDSCFSGSLFSLGRAIPEDISEKSALPVRQYITAGNENETVPDRSIFKRCLLLGLEGDADLTRDGYITGSELGMYLSDKVVQYTRRAQHPQYGKINNPDLDRGDFVFILAGGDVPGLRATISITSNVAGADVHIDETRVGNTPLSEIPVETGAHRIVVKKDDRKFEKIVTLEAGQSVSIDAYLPPPAPRPGHLYVDSSPEGSQIRLLNIEDSYRQGMKLKPGRYHVEVSKPGHDTKTEWITLSAGEDKYIAIRLAGKYVPPPAPQTGNLYVDSSPEGSQIRLLNIDEPYQRGMKLKSSRYHVEVSKPGHETKTEWITLSAGEDKYIDIRLAEKTAPPSDPQLGRLYVDAYPEGTDVKLLNIEEPYKRGMELKPGSYNVELSKKGYETTKEWIPLSAGEDKYINIRLAEKSAPAPEMKPAGLILTNSIGMSFAPIPKGTFMMGSPSQEPGRDSDEIEHSVTISRSFYLQTTEVTQRQWKAIMGNNPSRFKGNDRPVERVSWNGAQKFIRKLNLKEGTDKYRLPTEAEWEYACRAKTTTPFYTGDCVSTDQANYDGRDPAMNCTKGKYRKKTSEAGSFSPNPWGLYDMHGNVWEWCQDWYGGYITTHVTDPAGPSGSFRVLRGGSLSSVAKLMRSASRSSNKPFKGYDGNGFRIVRGW